MAGHASNRLASAAGATMRRLKFYLLLAYIPTLLLILFILAMLVIYFSGWRIWFVPPTPSPIPTFQVL